MLLDVGLLIFMTSISLTILALGVAVIIDIWRGNF